MCCLTKQQFQYPSSRVILPDIKYFGMPILTSEWFQYPSSRVILPDFDWVDDETSEAEEVSIPQ